MPGISASRNAVPFNKGISWTSYWSHLYISNLGGTGSGHTEATAITPAKLATLTILAGQKIHFKKGETFENFSIDITVDNVTIDSYGTGTAPILSGSSVIASGDWTSEGGGVYSLAKASVKWIYLDDTIFERAKTSMCQMSSKPAANQIQANAAATTILNGYTNLVGQKLRIFEYLWRMSYEYTITAYNAGLITTDRNIDGTLTTEYFFVYNYSEFLANEKWIYDGTTIKIQSALTIADHVICAGLVDNGINVTGDSCSITGITFKHYQRTAIKCYNKTISVTSCTLHDIRGNPVYVYGNSAIGNINSNTIYNAGNSGIHFGAVASGQAQSNTIYNIGNGLDIGWPVTDAFLNVPGYAGLSEFGTTDDVTKICGCGIVSDYDWVSAYALSDSLIIRYNTIYNTGYDGIKVIGNNHSIEYNHIYEFNIVYSDGSGINTFAGLAATYRDAGCSNISIKQNIIHSVTRLTAWKFLSPNAKICGIYLDYATSDTDVDGNVIYDGVSTPSDTYAGIYIYNYSTDIRISNNIINNFGNLALWSYTINNTNIKIYDNVFCNQLATLIRIYAQAYSGGGYLDTNKYINPVYGNILKLSATSYTLADWITATGQDASSAANVVYWAAKPISLLNDSVVYINATNSPVLTTIHAGYKDVDGDPITSTTLPAYSGILVLWDYTTVNANLMGGWTLDGHVSDYSGGGHDGTILGAPTSVAAKYINGYSINGGGSAKISVDDDDVFSFTDGLGTDLPFTISFWINPAAVTATRFIVAKIGSAITYEWAILQQTNELWFEVCSSDATKYLYAVIPFTTTGSWIHVYVTYDGSKNQAGLHIYTDLVEPAGITRGTVGVYAGMSNTNAPVYIGGWYAATYSLKGIIDEVKIINKVITPAEAVLIKANDASW